MNKKNTRNLTDQEPLYRYSKGFNNQQKTSNSAASSYLRSQKSAEYGTERNNLNQNSNFKFTNAQQQNKHNQSKGSIKQPIRREEKQTNTSRSRSKEKKDRLTLNLAKFSRKQPDKMKSPTSHHRQKQIESIYLQRGDKQQAVEKEQPQQYSKITIQRKQQSTEQGLVAEKSSIEHANRRSFFSQDFQDIISEVQQANIPNSPKQKILKNKAVEVTKQEVPSITPDYVQHRRQGYTNNAVTNKSENIINSEKLLVQQRSRKQIKESRGSQLMIDRQSYQLLRGQQNATIQQLNQRLKIQKQESSQMIRKLQTDKRELQQKNRNLIESQFKMRNELEILKVKNIELVKQSQNLKQLYLAANEMLEREKVKQQNLSDGLQQKYSKVCRELQAKQDEASQLSLTLHQLQSRCRQLQSRIKTLQNQKRISDKQSDCRQKQGQNELQQLMNSYQIKISELQLKSNAVGVQQARYRSMWQQMQSELKHLRKRLNLKDIEIQQLVQSQKEFKFKQKERKMELDNKYRQIDSLVLELNRNQEELVKQKSMHSETVKNYQTKLIKQQAQIDILQQDIRNIKSTNNLEKLQNSTLEAAFSLENTQAREEYNAFVELQRRQTDEMNQLRRQLQLKGEQMNRIQLQNQELKSKVRRVEQQNELGGRTLAVNLNNLKQAKDANELVLRSQVQSLKRKITSFQMRMKSKQNQIAQKNRFIKQFLMTDISKRQDSTSLLIRLQQALNK